METAASFEARFAPSSYPTEETFSVPEEEIDETSEVRKTTCLFCGTTVRYLADLRTMRKKRTAS
jgi:hypothetical protein